MRSQLAWGTPERKPALHKMLSVCFIISYIESPETLMSDQFLQNICLGSSKRRNPAASPLLLTIHDGLLKNVSRYRIYECLCFWCWLWESPHSSNKDNPQSNPVSVNLTIMAVAELDLRGWVRSPCETRGKDTADLPAACFSGVCRTWTDLQMSKYVQPVYIQMENSMKRLEIYLG